MNAKPTSSGLIVAAYGRRFLVECADGLVRDCVTRGKRNDYACGDEVLIEAQEGLQGVITRCEPRRTLLFRSDPWKQKLLAANTTQALIVVAPVPSFDLYVLDACLAACTGAGIRPLIVLNKTDLPESAKSAAALAPYAALGYTLLSLTARESVEPLLPCLRDARSVLIGESGMGKSTLLNKIAPLAAASTREVSAALGTGKHTTTHTRLHHLDATSSIIDTPGVQAFGVHHLGVENLAEAFIEFRPFLGQCKFRDCRHLSEPGCAISAAQESGVIHPRRLTSYRRLAEDHLRRQRPDWQ